LKSRLDKVLGLNASDEGDAPRARTTVEQARSVLNKPVPAIDIADTDVDDMEYFAKLAED
jgi:hypothetical protein